MKHFRQNSTKSAMKELNTIKLIHKVVIEYFKTVKFYGY